MKPNSNTCILIFSRLADEEAKHKNYARIAGKKRAGKVAEELIHFTQRTARLSGIPSFTIFSNQQKGQNFGERLANAAEELFAKGYDSIIISGSDSPTIIPASFIEIANSVSEKQLVITPAEDGGVCLIALHKKLYWQETLHSFDTLAN